MSHDTDKLIRQLSLVAFLMAERQPLTARDVQQNVEGYSEMSDEAFARRFYSDRAELHALRLALQNLTLGRPGFWEAPTPAAESVMVLDPDYSPQMAGRLAKLEGAISKGRTVRFDYFSISRDEERERTVEPYALFQDNGAWYVVGRDVEADGERTFRVSRIRRDIRFATRRERDFRIPADFEIDRFRGRPPWQVGEAAGEARIEVKGDTAWWVERAFGRAGRVEDGVFVTGYSSLPLLASWVLRQDGRAVPREPDALVDQVLEALEKTYERHEGPPAEPAAEAEREEV